MLVSCSTSIGPTSTIWCTAGVSGIVAPAIAAMRGLHTPHAIATCSVSMRPLSVIDGPDRAVGDLEVEDLGVGEHGEHALVDRLLAHQRAGLQRVDHRHARRVEPAEQHVGVDERDELLDLLRGEQAGVDAPGLGRGHPAPELLEPRFLAGDLDAAARRVDPELDVLALALQREQRHLLVVVGREDEVGRVPRRATGVGQRALVDEHEVGPAEPGEVPDQAVADDAGADHDATGRWGRRGSAHAGCYSTPTPGRVRSPWWW